MKLPCFCYTPENGESHTLKDCFRVAVNNCREHHAIATPDMREFWFARILKMVRWAEKRWPESFQW